MIKYGKEMLEVSVESKGDKRVFPKVSVEQSSPLVLVGALFLESIAPPYSGASVVRVSTSGCPSPTNGTADYHTVYNCLEPHHSLGVSQDLYKIASRLRLVAKPLSLELRASTLILELEWVYQSSGQPRES